MADDVPSTPYYDARPAVIVDGKKRPELGDALLQSLVVDETTLGLFRCEARFSNWDAREGDVDYLFFDRDVLDFGKPLAFEVGPPAGRRRVFDGRISAIEAQYPSSRAPELTVLAEDQFQDLRTRRRTRSFEDVTDADVFRRVAEGHGLKTDLDLDPGGPKYKVLAQVNQSDLAFLRERAAAADGELWVEDKTLHAAPRTRRNGGSVALTYGQDLVEFSVLADLAHQRTSVKVSGWDVGGKDQIDEEATELAVRGELGGGLLGGGSLLGSAFAERKERIVSAVPLAADEARAVAKARYLARARRFVRGTGMTDGTAALRVGATVELKGLGKMFSGKYYVTRCRHLFDLAHGYRTAFDAERPGIGQ